ncbi:carbon-nitrogen hydrolase family protein [Mangrovicoccus algicola]|uniref:Carbon-nitrogen hydrolase family protein n=1 Tax=Mangrovicoccus algicola TaxID=2771008 RepID=A0A8J6YY86_9RHOB|nr:carbon-nitrogen hydrolase family protein [Mangrovicoccus algicola]MBE3637958.1 carbon-nitrogen hydrolase family protein [Mangrovicoccus algicola]
MRIALLQMPARSATARDRMTALEEALAAAAAAGAALLVAPELVLPGYNCPQRHGAEAQPRGGPWMQAAAGMARRHGIGLVLGWAERAGGDVFNAATAFGPDGAELAHYRKIQLFGGMERTGFRAGEAPPPVFDLGGRRFGLLICYDIEFPEHARDLARRGAQAILVPTANPAGYEHVQRLLVPARACENAIAVAYANYCGAEDGLDFGGGSVIAGPDGAAIESAGHAPALLVADLPEAADYPADMLSAQLADLRRPGGD